MGIEMKIFLCDICFSIMCKDTRLQFWKRWVQDDTLYFILQNTKISYTNALCHAFCTLLV
ncbi:hypothetical protein BX666DRAFT_1960757 [Dichotomocladium elegans]|nr:hypothetical protein BX666DRAFT_1960757 [Dichotomocladium elegans]